MEPEVRHKPIRYYEIDLLRFIAAMSVVLFHFTYRGYHADGLSPVEYPALGSVFKYGYLGVELFFIISGYVVLLSAQGKTVGQFFTSRVMRLYPAYWVACTLTFIMMRLFGPAVDAPGWHMLNAPIKVYILNMSMLHHFFGTGDLDGVYWTLSIELVFYFLITLLISFRWFRHLPLVLAGWLGYCALVRPIVEVNAFSYLLFPRYAPFFIAGMVFYLLQTSQAARWKLYGLLGASFVLSLRSTRTELNEKMLVFHEHFSLLVGLGVVTLFFVVFWAVVSRRVRLGQAAWLGWAGALTYPIYLLHHNIGYIALQHLGGHVDKYVLLGGLFAGMLLLAYLLHVYVERRFSKMLGQQVQKLLARAAAKPERRAAVST